MRNNDVRLIVSRYRGWKRLHLSMFVLIFSVVCAPRTSVAILGSDWHVKTPGGNAVNGGDRCDAHGGVCLTGPENSSVYVSHIRRWRYYDDYVIGEREQGWFIFHEPSQQTQFFSDEAHWQETLNALAFGKPKSKWLTPKTANRYVWLMFPGALVVVVLFFSGVLWVAAFAVHKIVKRHKNRS